MAIAIAIPAIADNHGKAPDPSIPGQMDTSRVAAGSYATDPGHTLVSWKVSHFGFNDYIGLFGNITGTMQLDPVNPQAAKVDISIPVAEVTTASEGLTGHLLRAPKEEGGNPDFFGPEPDAARFVSTAVKVAENGTDATINGDLTLNGVTKPVTIDAKFSGAGTNPFNKKETVGFHGKTIIKRSDFGVMYGIPVVSDEVHLKISVAFEKQ
nr:YceI family protein [Parasphingorhabdus halotolerans]